jgi:GT2 family glycosyltransferase
VVLLVSERPLEAVRTVRSLGGLSLPCRLVLVDHTTRPSTRTAVESAAAEAGLRPIMLRPDHDLGAASGRALGVAALDTELVLFLDDDVEVVGGAIESLVAELDAHPESVAATGCVVLPSGQVQICGGALSIEEDFAVFRALGEGLAFDDPALGPAGACDWVPGGWLLLRRATLERHGLDPEMAAYFEDNEWCYRLHRAGEARFRAVPRAAVVHHLAARRPLESAAAEAVRLQPYLRSVVRFHQRHGKILHNLFVLLPQLVRNGRPDVAAARLLIDLAANHGESWLLEHWLSGALEPLLHPAEPVHDPSDPTRALRLAAEFDRGHAEALGILGRHADLLGRIDSLEARWAEGQQAARAAEIAHRFETAGQLQLQAEQESRLAALSAELAAVRGDLELMHRSRWYALARRYWRMRARLGATAPTPKADS